MARPKARPKRPARTARPKRPAPAPAPAPTAADRGAFVALSSALTGFTPIELEGTGNIDTHLTQLWTIIGPEICRELFASARLALAQDDAADREAAIKATIWASPKLGPVVQSLVRLWYYGKWNPLSAQWQETYRWDRPDPNASPVTVTPQAYVEGLVWTAIGAHPPGAKPPGHGSWAYPPALAPTVVPIKVTS